MKQSLILEICQAWCKLSRKEKIKLLQQFEECNAAFQKREVREVVENSSLEKGTAAVYSYDAPSYIFLSTLRDDNNAIDVLSDVYHEGFHAYVDDFFHDKSDLSLFSNVDAERMFKERELQHLLYNRAMQEGLLTLFSLKYYEEKLVRIETCLYFLYNLLQSCENLHDVNCILQLYHDRIMGAFYNYDRYAHMVDKTSKIQYDQLMALVQTVDIMFFKDHLQSISTTKEIHDVVHPQLLRHFEKNFKVFTRLQGEMRSLSRQQLTREFVKNIIEYTKAK